MGCQGLQGCQGSSLNPQCQIHPAGERISTIRGIPTTPQVRSFASLLGSTRMSDSKPQLLPKGITQRLQGYRLPMDSTGPKADKPSASSDRK